MKTSLWWMSAHVQSENISSYTYHWKMFMVGKRKANISNLNDYETSVPILLPLLFLSILIRKNISQQYHIISTSQALKCNMRHYYKCEGCSTVILSLLQLFRALWSTVCMDTQQPREQSLILSFLECRTIQEPAVHIMSKNVLVIVGKLSTVGKVKLGLETHICWWVLNCCESKNV